MLRLFVGLKMPADVRAALAPLAAGLPGARWVAPENLHLTLRFVGEVDEGQAEDIDGVLAAIAVPAFDMRLAGIDCFHSRGRVRMVWAGVTAGPELARLQAKIESAVVRAGFDPEGRKFKPHLTIARLKNVPIGGVRPYLELHGGFATKFFHVEEFTLFRSHLGQGGASYDALVDYPLDG
jgi:2'-5' RNA ligase